MTLALKRVRLIAAYSLYTAQSQYRVNHWFINIFGYYCTKFVQIHIKPVFYVLLNFSE